MSINKKVSHSLLLTTLFLLPLLSQAACVEKGLYTVCNDEQGNEFVICHFGGNTEIQGKNQQSGEEWSQKSHRFGPIISSVGNAAGGYSWRSNRIDLGHGNYTITGVDSDGCSFNYTCGPKGCF